MGSKARNRRPAAWLVVLFAAALGLALPHLHPRLSPTGIGEIAGSRSLVGATSSWALERVHAAAIRAYSQDGVVVAVVDTGIDFAALVGARPWEAEGEIPGNGVDDDGNGYIDDAFGWDFVRDAPVKPDSPPSHPHGTFVAGLIADSRFGVAPGVALLDVRVCDSRGRIPSWDVIARAIRYAVDRGAQVINLSLAFDSPPPPEVLSALEYARRRAVLIAGAGNSGGPVAYPARLPGVVAVSATSPEDVLAPFSGRGEEIALSAPGQEVPSVLPGGDWSTASGTSYAAAYVSGAVAALVGLYGDPATALSLLTRKAVDLGERGHDPLYGWGRLELAGLSR